MEDIFERELKSKKEVLNKQLQEIKMMVMMERKEVEIDEVGISRMRKILSDFDIFQYFEVLRRYITWKKMGSNFNAIELNKIDRQVNLFLLF